MYFGGRTYKRKILYSLARSHYNEPSTTKIVSAKASTIYKSHLRTRKSRSIISLLYVLQFTC